MWFVYILLCKDNSLYTGIAKDPDKRFKKHARGVGGAYTRAHRPLKIVYLEKAKDKSTALIREAEIKKLSRLQKEVLLTRINAKRPGGE